MSNEFVRNKYKAGDTVDAKTEPKLKLIVRRYIDQVYYCKIRGEPERKELVCYEGELVENHTLIAKNRTSESLKMKEEVLHSMPPGIPSEKNM